MINKKQSILFAITFAIIASILWALWKVVVGFTGTNYYILTFIIFIFPTGNEKNKNDTQT